VLDTLQRVYGSSTRYPIYSTEFGYQTIPPDGQGGTVTPTVAGRYLNWAEYLSWRDPRVRSFDQYLLIDAPGGGFASALIFANGKPKPGYFAFQLPIWLPVTTTTKGSPLEVWGCARPARYLGPGAKRVEIQFEPVGGSPFSTVKTVRLKGTGCYFDVLAKFPGSGSVRLRWSAPGGAAIFSRTVIVTLR
jgi:hypothetical protein